MYHPMNPDTDVTYQKVNLCSSDKCFIYYYCNTKIIKIFLNPQIYSVRSQNICVKKFKLGLNILNLPIFPEQ